MKFTVAFLTLLSISSTWAVSTKSEEPKDKRETPSSYPSSSSGYTSNYQTPLSHGDASAISVGAGYSIGGAKPAFNFAGHGAGSGLQLSSGSLQSGHGATYQLPPITLQPNQDLSQLMSQISQSIGSGALSLQPANNVAEFHESQGGHGQVSQEYSFPQFQQYSAPKYQQQQQYALAGQISSEPSYAAGTKGLSSYGSTGPVLFNPAQDQGGKQASLGYVAPNVAHSSDAGSYSLGGGHSLAGLSLGNAGHSFGGASLSLGSSGHDLAGLGHSLGSSGLSFDGTGYTFGGAGHSLAGAGQPITSAGHSLGGAAYSLDSLSSLGQPHTDFSHSLGISGASGHSLEGSSAAGLSLGGSGSPALHSISSSGSSLGGLGHSYYGSSPSKHYKVLSSNGHIGSSKTAFKPSTFLGASIPSESSSSASHGASYPSYAGSFLGGHSAVSFGGHGPSFGSFGGSSKGISSLYTKLEGSSLDSAGAYSSAGHLASPPGTTYGFPSSSFQGGSSSLHAASSSGPQHYVSSSKYPSSFGEGSSSYKSPGTAYSSLSSHSSGPKYSFSGRSNARFSPKDSHGAYSETSYNTIKYSEELRPHVH